MSLLTTSACTCGWFAPHSTDLGLTGENAQHPPLLGLTEAVFAYPLRTLVPDFFAIRLTYILYEVLCALFFWFALKRMLPDRGGEAVAGTSLRLYADVVDDLRGDGAG